MTDFTLTNISGSPGWRRLERDGVELAVINYNKHIVECASPTAAFRKQVKLIIARLLAEENIIRYAQVSQIVAEAESIIFRKEDK